MTSILVILAAVAGGDMCLADDAGFCAEPVVRRVIGYKEQNPRVKVNCALGTVTVVELPRGESLTGDPAIRNAALFRFKLQKDPLLLMLWPTVPEGSDLTSADLEGETSNVQINLASGISILLELRISQTGVQRVILNNPEQENVYALREKLKSEVRKELETSYESREENLEAEASRKALAITAKGIMKRVNCTSLRARAMSDLLVLRAHRICHIGDHVYVELSVHNRARDMFALSRLEVLAGDGENPVSLDALVEWEKDVSPHLKFDQKARAVAVFPVTEETAASEYVIRLEESAGKKRVVTLEGVEF